MEPAVRLHGAPGARKRDPHLGVEVAAEVERRVLGAARSPADRNDTFQILARRLSLVPHARWRYSWGDHDASLGLAIRAPLSTDLL